MRWAFEFRLLLECGGHCEIVIMESVPGAVATGSHSLRQADWQPLSRSLPLPLLTSTLKTRPSPQNLPSTGRRHDRLVKNSEHRAFRFGRTRTSRPLRLFGDLP